mgnify:FL=1
MPFSYIMDVRVRCSIVIEFRSCERPFGMMENRIGIMMMREMIGINVVDTILGMMMMMKVITPTRVGNVIMRMIRVIANILD